MTTTATITDLEVLERDTTVSPRALRTANFVPATVYGPGIGTPVSIQVDSHTIHQALLKGSRQFKLKGFLSADVHEKQIQKLPTKEFLLNIEFYAPQK